MGQSLTHTAHYAFEDSKDDPYSKNYGSESSSSCDTKLLESHMIAIHENTHRLHRLSVTGYDSES